MYRPVRFLCAPAIVVPADIYHAKNIRPRQAR